MTRVRGGAAVLVVAVVTFMIAVFHRSSLAVAGLMATDRFGLSAAELATLVVLQLVVYGALQIPVGLLVDRFGARRVLLAGTVVLASAQLLFAWSSDYGWAIVARVLVGVGDAMTFLCVMRLVNSWVAPGRVPLVLQLTGVASQVGTIAAALPMAWALSHLGWRVAYGAPATLGLLLTVVIYAVVRDAPGVRISRGLALTPRAVRRNLADSWSDRGTRLGFWVHFATPFSQTALGLLWGLPYFVEAQGTSTEEAAFLLTLMVCSSMVAAPALGWWVGRFPSQRSTLAMGLIALIAVVWAPVIMWPGHAPPMLLVVLVVVTGVGGPAAMIGFDLARTTTPEPRLATAMGIVNIAGFIASFSVMWGIGLVLDLTGDFAWAMSLQYVVWVGGFIQILRCRRIAHRHSRLGDETGPAPRPSAPVQTTPSMESCPNH